MPVKDAQGLTVVTLCRNNPDQLDLTLTSISRQTSSPSRVIVVDGSDASSRPESESIAQKHGAQYLYQNPSGVYAAMNRALANVKPSESVLFLNSGDWFASPKSVEIINNVLSGDPGSSWLVGDTLTVGPNGHKIGTRHRLPLPTRWALRVRDFWFPHPSTIYRASALKELGGFVTRFVIAADYFMSLKLFDNYGPPRIIPIVLSVHHLDGLSTEHPYSGPIERAKSRIRIYGLVQIFIEPGLLLIRFFREVRQVFLGHLRRVFVNGRVRNLTIDRLDTDHFCPQPGQKFWPDCCIDVLRGEVAPRKDGERLAD